MDSQFIFLFHVQNWTRAHPSHTHDTQQQTTNRRAAKTASKEIKNPTQLGFGRCEIDLPAK
jgi:hypothetical protein